MILLLDFGNTRVKWHWANHQGLVGESCSSDYQSKNLTTQLLDMVQSSFPDQQNQRIWPMLQSVAVASVKPSISDSVIKALEQLNLLVQTVRTAKQFDTLINGYHDVKQMGVDRWLAMIAARQLHSQIPTLVIDCGTAITIDAVAADGHHLGGYILPGLNRQLRALLENTEQVYATDFSRVQDVAFGQNTQDCVIKGICAQIIAVILHSLPRLDENPLPHIILTGGDGKLIKRLLNKELKDSKWAVELREALVFEGLLINALKELKKM